MRGAREVRPVPEGEEIEVDAATFAHALSGTFQLALLKCKSGSRYPST